jgi:hypothetical protein
MTGGVAPTKTSPAGSGTDIRLAGADVWEMYKAEASRIEETAEYVEVLGVRVLRRFGMRICGRCPLDLRL